MNYSDLWDRARGRDERKPTCVILETQSFLSLWVHSAAAASFVCVCILSLLPRKPNWECLEHRYLENGTFSVGSSPCLHAQCVCLSLCRQYKETTNPRSSCTCAESERGFKVNDCETLIEKSHIELWWRGSKNIQYLALYIIIIYTVYPYKYGEVVMTIGLCA